MLTQNGYQTKSQSLNIKTNWKKKIGQTYYNLEIAYQFQVEDIEKMINCTPIR